MSWAFIAGNLVDRTPSQINLVVGDYFKSGSRTLLLTYTEKANELITWLRSKTQLLGILREIQAALHAANPGSRKEVLSVIRAVLTRWTAHYLAYQRLLDLRRPLEQMVDADEDLPINERRVITGTAAVRAKARAMVGIIKDPVFWHSIAKCGPFYL